MPITTHTIIKRKQEQKKITALTAYDYLTAMVLDKAGIDIILVGDSLAQVALGYESTLHVSVDEMLHHAKAVKRGVKNSFVVVDLPFMSYQVSVEEALTNAGKLMKSGANAVKLEGASEHNINVIKRLKECGIPVMGHLGFTPQSVNALGGNRVQSKTANETNMLLEDAKRLEKAGCFAVVLELVPHEAASKITRELSIPTVGIGAGSDCDGQILVTDDLLGRFTEFKPSFVRRYAEIAKTSEEAVLEYINDVQTGKYPKLEESFYMNEKEVERLNQ